MKTPTHISVAVITLVSALGFAVATTAESSSVQLSAERSELTATEGLLGLIASAKLPCDKVRKVSVLISGETFRVRCTGPFQDYIIEAREKDAIITRVID